MINMKNFSWKRILPHLLAIGIFLVVALAYCHPAISGKVLQQSDVTQWQGMSKDAFNYREKHGVFPLWINNLFSGMPSFQVGATYNNMLPYYAISILSLYLPHPIHFFFLACLSMYFLLQLLRVNRVVSIMGALAFAYATYNPAVIVAGHETKMLSICFMPALLGSVLLIYQRRYWLGAALTALTASILVAANHMQIVYYTLIIIAALTISYVIRWIREKDIKHLVTAGITVVIAGVIGVLVNASLLFSTYDYSKATIRGGSELSNNMSDGKGGLSKDYALSYSMYKTEPLTMMFPKLYGGSTNPAEFTPESSKAMEALSAMPQELQGQVQGSYEAYWGGIGPIPTSAPAYIGAIICFLAIIGMFILDNEHKWWIFGVTVVTIMMSWGLYFDSFNSWLLQHLPMYNKFRVPSMILVVPQVVLVVLAALSLDKILAFPALQNKAIFQKQYNKGLIAAGCFFAFAFLLYLTADFYSTGDLEMLKQLKQIPDAQAQLKDLINGFLNGLKADRQSLMLGTIFRSLVLCAITAGLVYFFFKGKLKALPLTVILAVLVFGDLLTIDIKYLNSDLFQDKEEYQASFFTPTAADNAIAQDKSFFRVFNTTRNPFNDAITAYFHNCVGGYNPAKLSIYQDLIERQLSKQPFNLPVYNMLNTKYFIVGNPANPQVQQNPGALGNAWFINNVHWVNGAEEAMKALDNFNPKDTAVVDKQFQSAVHFDANSVDSAAQIKLVNNDNDLIQYTSANSKNGFGVFSEVYYKNGWKAFIDGQEAPIARVNYVLRGVSIPAGNHKIEFRFDPESHRVGSQVTSVCSTLMVLVLLGGLFMEFRKPKKNTTLPA